jgi:uncharacterized protein YndB with AHSA1/START domain
MIDARVVEIHRRLPAPIGEVFRWWTEPDLLCEWMTPIGNVEADIDLRVGGALRIVMKGDGRVIEHTGEYLEIDPPRRLVFTWVSPYTGNWPSVITSSSTPQARTQPTYISFIRSCPMTRPGRTARDGARCSTV